MNDVVVQSYVSELLAEARDGLVIESDDQWIGEENLKARYMQIALRTTIDRTQTLRSIQMQIAAEISRGQLWLHHPPTEDYPNGYGDLNEMLDDVGFNGRTKSVLMSIGDKIVPFCDSNGIDIDRFLVNSLRPKLEDALPALKSGIAANDLAVVEEVLGDVESFDGRDSIRMKYSQPRRERIGKATTVHLPDEQVAVVMMLESDDHTEELVRRIAGMVEWGLPAGVEQDGRTTTVTIFDIS